MALKSWQDKKGRFKKGKPSWNKGIPFSNDTKKLWSKIRKGRRQSPKTEFKSCDVSGDKNVNWKGGITPLMDQIRHCFGYRQWRSDVFTRDNFTCQECNKKGVSLHAHHIKEFHKIIEEYNIETLEEALVCEELWNINNGKTLCELCHDILEKG